MSKAVRSKKNWHVESIIKAFYRHYPNFFRGGKVKLCSKIYYPLALLELEVLESAGEEFDTIEHAILSLIYAGIADQAQLSDVLGLPLNYTRQIIAVLQGYGHVTEDMRITELGAKSADERVKFTKMMVRQKVQADSITGLLLDKYWVQRVSAMYASEETNLRIPHLAPRAHLSSETLAQVNEVIAKYKYSEHAIFHANAEQVTDVVSKEVKYTQALLLVFEHLPHPLVLIQNQDGYAPFAVSESVAHMVGELPETIRVVPDDRFGTITQLASDIRDGLAAGEKEQQRLRAKAARCFGSMADAGQLSVHSSEMQVELVLPALTIERINREVYAVLESVALSEYHLPFMWLSRDDEFPGMVCYTSTRVPELLAFSRAAVQLWLSQPDGSDIYNALIARLDFQGSPSVTLEQLQRALEAIIVEQDALRQSEVQP